MTKLSDIIINKIKEKELKPKPRWWFDFGQLGWWSLSLLFILLAGAGLSVLLFFAFDNDWLISGPIRHLVLGRAIWFWLIVVLMAIVGFFYDVRQTKNGYRYQGLIIVLVIIFSALLFGFLTKGRDLPRNIDNSMSALPFYENRNQAMMNMWQRPGEGFLAGRITKVENDDNFLFRDFSDKDWFVDSRQALWRHNLRAEAGLEIKLIGQVAGPGEFVASDIRPWNGGGCRMMEESGRQPEKGGCRMMQP